jgi:hypothetical protein
VDRRKHAPTLWLCWCILVVATGDNKAFSQDLFDYVPNLPYTAKVVNSYLVSLADGTLVRRETRVVQMRDSQGRTRIETFPPADPGCNLVSDRPDMVNLYVPLRRQFIQLVVARKIARVMTFPGTGPIPTHGANPNAVEITTKNLPGQTVNGIHAVGTRTTVRVPADDGNSPDVVDVQESWVSPDLEIVVLAKHESTARGSDDARWEIQKLDRSEPDAAFFEIPTDYKTVTATFDGSQADSPPESSSKEQPASRP